MVRLIVVALSGIATMAGYLQEGRRLQIIQRLPGDRARDLYEAKRNRDERLMWLVAILLAAGAVAATVRELALG